MMPIQKPAWGTLFEMQPPDKWAISTHEDMNYVWICSGDMFLYEYHFQDAQEAHSKSWELWRKWKRG